MTLMLSTRRERLRLALMFSAGLLALSLGSCLSFAEEGGDSINAGLSLAALGQKDAACSTFAELNTKFPKAQETIRDEVKAEQKKARC